MKLREIAEKLACTVEGDEKLEITGVAGIEEAKTGELTFLVNRKYRPALETTRASAILLAPDEPRPRIAALRSSNPISRFRSRHRNIPSHAALRSRASTPRP